MHKQHVVAPRLCVIYGEKTTLCFHHSFIIHKRGGEEERGQKNRTAVAGCGQCLCVEMQLRSPKVSKKQVRFEHKDRKKGKRKTERLINRWKSWQKRIRDQEIKDKKDVKRESKI